MIGILCNKKRERFIVRRLHTLFRSLIKDNDMPIVVFTLQGLDLQQNMVTGWMISCKRPSVIKTKLPALIFNLAVQFSKSEIKNLRGLMEIVDVTLLNITNRFNQRSIMEMLSSDNSVKKYVLPYVDLDDKNSSKGFPGNENLIVKPLKGSNLRKIIYWKHCDSVSQQDEKSAKFTCNGFELKNEVSREIKINGVLLLKTPELMVNGGYLCVTRIYAQRSINGNWEALPRISVPQNECACDIADSVLNDASIRIVSHINQFIPDMFFCYADYVADIKGIPYLLSFGGWTNKILSRVHFRNIRERVCKNMLEYAQAFINRPTEGGDYVD